MVFEGPLGILGLIIIKSGLLVLLETERVFSLVYSGLFKKIVDSRSI